MAADADIVTVILARVSKLNPGIPAEVIARIETEVRKEWGGARLYIARHTDNQRAAALADITAGASIDEVEHRHGLSRRTLYRLLSEKRGT